MIKRAGVTYTQTENGHPIVLMPANIGPKKLKRMSFRKPRKRRYCAVSRRHRTSFDLTNQVIVYFEPGGSGKYEVVGGSTPGHGGGNEHFPARQKTVELDVTPVDGNRKGRPKGSKNKSPPSTSSPSGSSAFNYRCEKRSLTYTFAGPVKCKSCDRTFNGDPVAHCLEHHKSVCPICGRTYRPPLSAHIKSHGSRYVSLTVSCYECYACKEKFGNHSTMAEHILTVHSVTAAECSLCGAVAFETVGAAVNHLVDAHCPRKTFSHPTVYRCRVCLAGFKTQINVLRHACNKIKSPQCGQCGKSFPSKMRYAFHLQFHEHPKWATMHLHCDLCLAEFDDEYQLYDHIRFRHELHDKAVCEVCGRTFKSSMGLNIHRRYHTGSRDFTCKSCDKSFLNKSTLREHEISHMDVKPFQCHICGQYLSRASRLRSHVKTHRAAESTEQTCYGCSECGYVAPNPAAVADHSSKEHCGDDARTTAANECGCYAVQLPSVVKCEYCDSTYLDAVHLNRHREAAHAGGGSGDAEAFICVVCSSTFSTYSRLTTHKLTHGINMESSCNAPAQQQLDEQQQKLQQQQQMQPAPDQVPDRFEIPQFFSCEHCAKMCLHYTYFCLHRRLKHPPGVQTHTCDQCGVDFKTSWRLTYHKKTAHGHPAAAADEKPTEMFNCTVCSRQFVKIGALNLHKTRTHIDAVGDVCKYLCHQCGKFFSSEFSLKSHVKTHEFVIGGCTDDHAHDNTNDCDEPAAIASQTVQARPNYRRRTYRKQAVATAVRSAKKSCPYCTHTIEDETAFIEHVNGHIRSCNTVLPTGTVCELCDEHFADSAQLKHHLDDHVNANQGLLCRACYSPFLSAATHDAHVAAGCQFAVTMPVNAIGDSALTAVTSDVRFSDPSTDAAPADVKITEPSTDTAPADVKFTEPSTAATPDDVKFTEPSTASNPPDVKFTEPSTASAPPDVKFVGTPAAPQSDARPLIVDCSEIFAKGDAVTPSSAEPPLFKVPPADDKSTETSVIDELLSILSTPRSLAALDNIDIQPSDDMTLDAIFNSISAAD
ncbi:zinc finger protein 26-like [Rhopalosiphum padi]|uniref:zinc finger protein 26-like n=1 Tax=Rhopalosiphum padi TaxID=40932 RepID=UPI00298EC66E|nr:zinc finger protein 26-like [Rhopalosiphum padi]